jgi:UDP-GlcNAc:undecaprenyl-phosphate/decaprenyl-phosphate GlcNAc-1-phosphate transferase
LLDLAFTDIVFSAPLELLAVSFLGMFGLSWLLNAILIRFAGRIEAISAGSPGQVRWENKAKPLVGGISFFIAFLFLLALQSHLFAPSPAVGYEWVCFLVVGTMGFLVGLVDDAFTTRPLLKLSGQVACGVAYCAMGMTIHFWGHEPFDLLLTIIWVVGLMNSINMLDNMDGITGSVACSLFIVASLWTNDPLIQWINIGMVGVMLGYLLLNWHPSKLYMGDTGSQFLGALLAGYGIYWGWNAPAADSNWFLSGYLPLLLFFIPILDTTFVTVARLARGQSPAIGGRDHTTHHLFYNGFHPRTIALLFGGVNLLMGIFALLISRAELGSQMLLVSLSSVLMVAIVVAMGWLYRRGNRLKQSITGT